MSTTDEIVQATVNVKDRETDLQSLIDFKAKSGALRLKLDIGPDETTAAGTEKRADDAIKRVCNDYLPAQALLDLIINCADARLQHAQANLMAVITDTKVRTDVNAFVKGGGVS